MMSPSRPRLLERQAFCQIRDELMSELRAGEHLFLSLSGEQSQFIRWNQSKVRQVGLVEDFSLELTLVIETAEGRKSIQHQIQLGGDEEADRMRCRETLLFMRTEIAGTPIDPFAILPQNFPSIDDQRTPELLDPEHAAEILAAPLGDLDLAGGYASGPIIRALATSAGQTAWFSTATFHFDYSLYTRDQKALKSTFSAPQWDLAAYLENVNHARTQLALMQRPEVRVKPGEYRTYLARAALAELIPMLSGAGLSEAAIQQGQSGLRKLRSGSSLSPLLFLSEDFSSGLVPRFSPTGEIAPQKLELIGEGKLVSTLISARTAREYRLAANGAVPAENMRAPHVAGGALTEEKILSALGTGLYLNNLHYLNWSDRNEGRITGLTRYACFWVEGGEIVGPINTLRWDDTVYRMLGTELETLTRKCEFSPDVSTYQLRSLGGVSTPGALLRSMRFTL